MDRRDALGTLGAAALGLVGGNPAARGAEHDKLTVPDALGQLHAYLCAFHTAKKDPKLVIEAHHYCSMVSEGVHQCIVFDSNGKNARILGVEYIVSDKIYRTLPAAEQKYYHPHTYEILSGLLIAPGMPEAAEKEFMGNLLTTWGKTWHTWPDPKTTLPLGEPLLMWAATKDGLIPDAVLADRDTKFMVDTAAIRRRRAYLGEVPQVDPPKTLDDLGRQWTNDGADEPKRR